MLLTIDTKRLRLFLENDAWQEKQANILFEMMYSEPSREKSDAVWWGLHHLRQDISRRIECIRERGGLLHVGANFGPVA